MNIAEQVLKNHNLSKKELARLLDCSQSLVTRLVNGTRTITPQHLEKLLQIRKFGPKAKLLFPEIFSEKMSVNRLMKENAALRYKIERLGNQRSMKIDVSKIREKLGLKQEELAELLGVTQAAVTYFEQGKRNPSKAVFKKLFLLEQFGLVALEQFKEVFYPDETIRELKRKLAE